jgi:hypothetical protein
MRIRWMGARGKAARSPSEHCLESRDGVERVVDTTASSPQAFDAGPPAGRAWTAGHSSGLEMKALNLRVCQVRGEAGHRDGAGGGQRIPRSSKPCPQLTFVPALGRVRASAQRWNTPLRAIFKHAHHICTLRGAWGSVRESMDDNHGNCAETVPGRLKAPQGGLELQLVELSRAKNGCTVLPSRKSRPLPMRVTYPAHASL